MRTARNRSLLITIVVSALIGCREGVSNRYIVSGKVLYEGQPVRSGFITFVPDGRRGNSGPAGVAEIDDGSYSTGRKRGVIGGFYVARITAYDGQPREIPGEGLAPTGRVLVEEHVVELDLPHDDTIRDFNITRP